MSVQGMPLFSNLLRLYYAATALFLLLDYALGINVRLASLAPFPGWRALYYLLCFGCLALMVWRPDWSQWIATLESLLTLSMLIIAMGVRVMTVSDTMLTTGAGFITSEEVINFIISGGAAWIAYTRGAQVIHKDLQNR
ncbi:MAG: hypothetical protein ACR2Q3_15860 [Woeseiaceae bacterium]